MLDPQEYLAPGYDISKLTVANLRSVLVEHEVSFPSNATKSQLIDIFNKDVKSRADEILKRYNVHPSRNDIIDISGNLEIEEKKGQSGLIKEPSPVSDKDKIIPSKRQSDSATPLKKSKRKTRKRVGSTTFSDDSSASPTNSFLSMEKFEINENDNIFKGPIDDTPITLLNKTKYANKKAKIPVKDILSKFDKSVPSSKVFKPEKSTLKSKSESPSPVKDLNLLKAEPVDTANKTIDNIYYTDNEINSELVFMKHDTTVDRQVESVVDVVIDGDSNGADFDDNKINNTFDHKHADSGTVLLGAIVESTENNKKLRGPTKNIKEPEPESVISLASSDSDEIEIVEEKADEHLVSTLDVKSFSSMETDDASFSRDSIDIDKNDNEEFEKEETLLDKLDSEKIEFKTETIEATDHRFKIGTLFRVIWRFFLLVNILLLVFLSLSLREVKLNTGYCGFENSGKPLDLWGKLPDSLQNNLLAAKPFVERLESTIVNTAKFQCEDCPKNGICELKKLTCDYGYVKTYPAKSVLGLVPLQEICEYDYLREEKIRYLSKYTLSYLHRHNEKQLTLDELHDYLRSTKPSSMSAEEYEGYWKKFVEDELSKEPDLSIDFNTKEITLSHRTPTEYYTRTFGNVQRGKKSKNLFKKTPPTVNLKNYYTKTSV